MNVSAVTGGSGVGSASHCQDSQTHFVRFGESLDSIAAQYGVTPQALREANPLVFNPTFLSPGMSLNIPQCAESAGSAQSIPDDVSGPGISGSLRGTERETTQFTNPPGTTDGFTENLSEFNRFSLGYDFETGALSGSATTGFDHQITSTRGYGVSFGVEAEISGSGNVRTENGLTTHTVAAEVSVSASAGAQIPKASVEVTGTSGGRLEYEVSIPANMGDVSPAEVNPFNPESMPVGSRVTLDSEVFLGTEFEASFRGLAVKSGIEVSEGVSISVERTGQDTVRITSGPTQAIEAYNGIGVKLGDISAMLGRTDTLDTARLNTAEFDISTEDGQAAYNDLLIRGEIPVADQPGVSNIAAIERVNYDSATAIDLKTPLATLSVDGTSNSGSTVRTSYTDGRVEEVSTLQYGDNVPLTIERHYDAQGNEQIDQRTYSFEIDLGDPPDTSDRNALQKIGDFFFGGPRESNLHQVFNAALAGDPGAADTGPVPQYGAVSIELSHAEILELRGVTQQANNHAEAQGRSIDRLDHYLDFSLPAEFGSDAGMDFAIGLIRGNSAFMGNPHAFAESLHEISNLSTGSWTDSRFTPLPGSVAGAS